MPTYEYRCAEGHEFERFFRKISDAPVEVVCPVCGKLAERRVSAGGGLVFKGSGFYLTDYGKNAHRKGEPAESKGGEGAGEAKSEGKSEKTEAKGETKAESKSESAQSGKSADAKPAESKSSSSKPSGAAPPSSGKSKSDS